MNNGLRKRLRIAFFNSADISSGAESLIDSTVRSLISRGVDARLYVMDKLGSGEYVYQIPRFPAERRIEKAIRGTTGLNNIFFPSTLLLRRDPWLQDADVWHFHNLHGHFVSIPLLARASRERRIVLSPVDEFLSTGYCTYSLGCERFRQSCGACPQLDLPYPGLSRDTTSRLLRMKKKALVGSKFSILVHTDYLARHYASTFVGQLPIERIHYGIDVDVFRPLPRDECAAALNLPCQSGFVAALVHSYVDEERKGLLGLLEPLQSIARQTTERIRVVVVGRSSERAREFETPELGITTLPFLADGDELAKALNLSDVLLYPTKADNLSLTCLKALACGVPVISSGVGGQGEAIKDGVNGFLCDPDRPEQFIGRLGQLLGNPELRERLSLAARRTVVERFSLDAYADNLVAYYDREVRSWKD